MSPPTVTQGGLGTPGVVTWTQLHRTFLERDPPPSPPFLRHLGWGGAMGGGLSPIPCCCLSGLGEPPQPPPFPSPTHWMCDVTPSSLLLSPPAPFCCPPVVSPCLSAPYVDPHVSLFPFPPPIAISMFPLPISQPQTPHHLCRPLLSPIPPCLLLGSPLQAITGAAGHPDGGGQP